MKLRPSLAAYDTLRATLLHSNYTDCGGEPLTDQDVVRQLAFHSSVLGTFHPWPLCFNYRGWPNQRHCLKDEGPILYHQNMHGLERIIRSHGTRVPTVILRVDKVGRGGHRLARVLVVVGKRVAHSETPARASTIDVSEQRPSNRVRCGCVRAPSVAIRRVPSHDAYRTPTTARTRLRHAT